MSVLQLPDDPDGFRRQNGLLIPWPQVVSEIVPSIRPNEHVTFLGRTGWGKSWLMRHLLELVAGKRRVPKLKKYQFAYRNLTDDTLGVIQAPATMAGGAIAQRAAGEWTRSRRFQALYGGD